MELLVHGADGARLPLCDGKVLEIGSAPGCALRPPMPGLPATVATVAPAQGEAWLHLPQSGSEACPVFVNARPIRALARLHPGDRICIDTWRVDLLGRPPAPWGEEDGTDGAGSTGAGTPPAAGRAVARRPADVFALRSLNGAGHGGLHVGPVLHLDADGAIVTAAAGLVEIGLSGHRLRLDPGPVAVLVNGHSVRIPARLHAGDQLRIGARRYRVETWLQGSDPVMPEQDPADRPEPLAVVSEGPDAPTRPGGSLLWLVLVAALLAAVLTGLLTWRGL